MIETKSPRSLLPIVKDLTGDPYLKYAELRPTPTDCPTLTVATFPVTTSMDVEVGLII